MSYVDRRTAVVAELLEQSEEPMFHWPARASRWSFRFAMVVWIPAAILVWVPDSLRYRGGSDDAARVIETIAAALLVAFFLSLAVSLAAKLFLWQWRFRLRLANQRHWRSIMEEIGTKHSDAD